MTNLHAFLSLGYLGAVTAVEQAEHRLVFQRRMDFIADIELQAVEVTCDATFDDSVLKRVMRAIQVKAIFNDFPGQLGMTRLNAVRHITDNGVVMRVGASQEALNRLDVLV